MKYEGIMNKNWKPWMVTIFNAIFKFNKDRTSYGYLSIFPNKDNSAVVYEERHRKSSLESAYNSDDEDSRGYIEPDNEDGDPDLGVKTEEFVIAGEEHNKFIEIPMDAPVESKKNKIPIWIDHQTVCSALKVIRTKSIRYAEKKTQELTEKRLDEIFNMLQDIQKHK